MTCAQTSPGTIQNRLYYCGRFGVVKYAWVVLVSVRAEVGEGEGAEVGLSAADHGRLPDAPVNVRFSIANVSFNRGKTTLEENVWIDE